MSKAVLISINPKWCAMIASGEKTVEVRKNRPQIKPPFKCYIYCTKHNNDKLSHWSGKVIGEFVCDRLDPLPYGQSYNQLNVCFWISAGARLKAKELYDYAKGKTVCGWHISDLKIYDTPKELGEFAGNGSTFAFTDDGKKILLSGMKRPPQSWCYVYD